MPFPTVFEQGPVSNGVLVQANESTKVAVRPGSSYWGINFGIVQAKIYSTDASGALLATLNVGGGGRF